MVIVVADSGSTKTDWRFINEAGKEIARKRSIGFNPYFHNSEFIATEAKSSFEDLTVDLSEVSQVHFYGAGCSSADRVATVKNGLEAVFTQAVVEVDHDLVGACRATLGNKPGIACIIGTGSNSCVWDGSEVVENFPSHGYILGDEGSGAYLGMELLKLYFNKELPDHLIAPFEQTFPYTEKELIENVYQKPDPNVFLASFARFFSDYPDDRTLHRIVYKGLCDFFFKRIIKYTNYKSYQLGFVGSIAFHFSDMVKKITKLHGLELNCIDKCPVDGLVQYHDPRKELV